MRIIAALSDPYGHYDRLRRVFERSAAAAMPGVEIDVLDLPASPSRQHAMAAAFLAAARRAVERAEPVAVCDVDLLFLRSIEPAFRRRFDVAVTVRETAMRYNTGLWFYRPSGRAFVLAWCEWVERILAAPQGHRAIVERYGGIDQAALAVAADEDTEHVVAELRCREWNATQSEWEGVDGSTRVVHVKSALRRHVLGQQRSADPAILRLAERWREWA